MKPKRNERRLCGATLKTAEVLQTYVLHLTYYIFLPLQVGGGRAAKNGEVKKRSRDTFHQREGIRRCVACSVPIDNSNLGGSDHVSAFYDPISCYSCANRFAPFLLNQREVSE